MEFFITQFIGGLGYSILALSYYQKTKRKILFMQIISYLFFTIHYYLLNGITGAICNLIGLIAFIIIYFFDKYSVKNKNILTVCLIPFIIVIALLTYTDIYSIFPIIASVIVIISFITDDENSIRIIGIVSALCWLIYAIAFQSYVAIVFEAVTLIVVVLAFFKNRNKLN